MREVYNNRRIIWESKSKTIRSVIFSFLFVAGAVWTRAGYSPWLFWFNVVFFGGCGAVALYQLLSPRIMFVNPDSKLGREIREALDAEAMEQVQFFDGGFSLLENPDMPPREYHWKELEAAFGYKTDCYTTDEIYLDLFWADAACLTLSESTPHWLTILAELHKHVPAVSPSWYADIMVPAFETTLTLLFDAQGRSQAEAEQAYYGAPAKP
ncbi:hypothetical protein [Hymenobacter sp. APR13]|uniref:hypothetical protein n=1 Tax=Hymenobacter sp. APR13 TaxID=1356852 RepID=UPI0012E070D2|nr:hypothetical protein [Hymenobacter sp. APR13]